MAMASFDGANLGDAIDGGECRVHPGIIGGAIPAP
jgi:hypothetical protein